MHVNLLRYNSTGLSLRGIPYEPTSDETAETFVASPCRSEHPIVGFVGADPNPRGCVVLDYGHRPEVRADACGPQLTFEWFEAERWMPGIGLPEAKILEREFLNVLWEGVVALPKVGRRFRFHGNEVSRPLLSSALARRTKSSNFPAPASAFI